MIKDTVEEYFGTTLTNQNIENILNGKDKDGNDLA